MFIAIELSPAIRRWLEGAKTVLSPRLPPDAVRWVDPGAIHLTLKFLGDVPSRRTGEIRAVMDGLAPSFRTFPFSADGLGCFPNTARPRVIWAGIQGGPMLGDLQKRLEQGLERIGFPAERRAFSPHLTLGRVKDGVAAVRLEEIGRAVETVSMESTAGMEVKDVCLFRSVLQPGGAVYTVLYRAPLTG
ncbi:MAG: RNA 2',3'-cyclic phosphodiesterase [Anaerolineales bacterium]|nr:RNA 2',3'-cyclic phosphodiesterase [Anaerolineales bacterium]